MSVEIRIQPELINDDSVLLLNWLVEDEKPVEVDQSIAEIETSKVVYEISVPERGILIHKRHAGEYVPVKELIALILSENEFADWKAQRLTQDHSTKPEKIKKENLPVQTNSLSSPIRITPGAKRLLDALDINPNDVCTHGVVREQDVIAFLKAKSNQTAFKAESEFHTSFHPHHEPPLELLKKWKISNYPKNIKSKTIYTKEFITRTLTGRCSVLLGKSPFLLNFISSLIVGVVFVSQWVIWLAAKTPILETGLEILARIYKRNLFGFFLRGAYYKAKLAKMGSDTIIDQNVEIWGPHNVYIGDGCHLDMYARLAAGEIIHTQKGEIVIGDNVHIGPYTHLSGRGGIKIGNYTAITAGTKIFSATNVGFNPEDPFDLLPMSHAAPLDRQNVMEAPVEIADYVFVGLNVCILPGVKIGRGAIINSGSIITNNVPEFAIVGGNPARILGYRIPR